MNLKQRDPKKELMLDLSYAQFAGLINHFKDYLEKPAELAVHLCSEEGNESYSVLYNLMLHYDLYLEHAKEVGYPKPDLENIIAAATEKGDPYILEVVLMGLSQNKNPAYSKEAHEIIDQQKQQQTSSFELKA